MSPTAPTPAQSLGAHSVTHVVTRFGPPHTGDAPQEWLLTNAIGGFAMGTPTGVLRRRYHGLLIAAATPPVDRYLALTSLDEAILLPKDASHQRRFHLASHRFADGSMRPESHGHLARFECTPAACTWSHHFAGIELTKHVSLVRKRNCCAVQYIMRGAPVGTVIIITPRLAMRDFHEVNETLDTLTFDLQADQQRFVVKRSGRALSLRTSAGIGIESPSILPTLQLEDESERGQPDVEALYSPGYFMITSTDEQSFRFEIIAALAPDEPDANLFTPKHHHRPTSTSPQLVASPHVNQGALDALTIAADAFVVDRTVDGRPLKTIIAGYPWFADWGRDTMIALPGLLLTTGRFADARSCLETFANHVSKGMIPNRFDDYGKAPHYNTVDASLWFIHASTEYLRASDDRDTFDAALLPACLEIIEAYRTATRYGIHTDPADGLITAGDTSTQLTWMDARRDGVVFTPRHGKAVEINALWHHALHVVANAVGESDPRRATFLRDLATRVGESFRKQFWRADDQYLNDCIQPAADGTWTTCAQIRPNQIFAVSLKHSPLETHQQQAVVANVREHLLTPFGLRTLAPSDPHYQPRFEGDMKSRDRAYHNGTVWPWLIGPFAEAILRTNGFSQEAKSEVRELLRPLIESLGSGCFGQIAEVYDAQSPQRAQGCAAQAWSVAEVLRLAALVTE